jgi:hypothetical protein
MQSTNLIPGILDAFSRDILPFDGVAVPSDEQVMGACAVITRYAGLLQAADLSLSQRDAGAMLQARLNADRKARLPEIKAQVDALIAARP